MNIHHLELFYYVAKHGGISAAARKIPYGIQQPAISAQVLRLEQELGQTLFHRRPFKLTSAGEELQRFVDPFFGQLEAVARRLRGGEETHLAIGAQELILRDYLPPILRSMRSRVPRFSFTLHSLSMDEIEQRLLNQQLDLGFGPLAGQRAEGLKHSVIAEFPLALLVPIAGKLRSASALWKQQRICEPLVTLPAHAPVARQFQQALQKRGVEWLPSLELPSLDLVARYVAEGHGVGLTLQLPRTPAPEGTRLLPLAGFPSLPIGAIWLGTISPIERLLVDEATAFVKHLGSASDAPIAS
jgi:DNA-binding transcriptional LysR family regulator